MGGAELLHHIVRPDQLVTVKFQFLGCQQIGDVLFVYVIFQLQSLDILGQLGAVLECGTVCLGLLQLLLVVLHARLDAVNVHVLVGLNGLAGFVQLRLHGGGSVLLRLDVCGIGFRDLLHGVLVGDADAFQKFLIDHRDNSFSKKIKCMKKAPQSRCFS